MRSKTRFESLCVKTLMAVASVVIVAAPRAAQAQTQTLCGPEVKEEVVKALAAVEGAAADVQLAAENELYAKFRFCAQDATAFPVSSSFLIAARECGAA